MSLPPYMIMRSIFLCWLTLCVALAPASVNAESAVSDRLTFPGTGLSVIPPPGLHPGPVGTYLVDATGETIIVFTGGSAASKVDDDPVFRRLFSTTPPEHFEKGRLTGTLYRRTRAADGGKWDGWWLPGRFGEKPFGILVEYTGSSSATFDALKDFFSTIEWDGRELDPELAFGVSVAVPDLKRVSTGFGGLFFTETGRPEESGASLIVQAMPVPASVAPNIFSAACGAGFAAMFKNTPHSGPHMLEKDGKRACDGWSVNETARAQYLMLMILPNGALLDAIGYDAPDHFSDTGNRFRSSLMESRILRGQNGSRP